MDGFDFFGFLFSASASFWVMGMVVGFMLKILR